MVELVPVDHDPFADNSQALTIRPAAATRPWQPGDGGYRDPFGNYVVPGGAPVMDDGTRLVPDGKGGWDRPHGGATGTWDERSAPTFLEVMRSLPQTLPMEAANIGRSVLSAVTAPGDALMGKLDPMSNEGIQRAVNLAGMVSGGGGFPRVPEADFLASKSPFIYDPPSRPLRDITKDYPKKAYPDGPPIGPDGRITHDIEGRPLTAPYIAGRTSGVGPEQTIAPTQFDAISQATIGSVPVGVAKSKVPGGGVGVFSTVRGADGPERNIAYSRDLGPTDQNRIIAHEIGHMVDELSSRIDTDPLMHELPRVYNTLNNTNRATKPGTGRYGPQTGEAARGRFWTPEDNGYKSSEAPREYMAEAIRAYMADPNYLKSVAPDTAAAIRAAVNNNPRLNKVIQFNAGSPLTAAALTSQGGNKTMPQFVPVDNDPFALASPPSVTFKPVDHDPFADDGGVRPLTIRPGDGAAAIGQGLINGVPIVGPALLSGIDHAIVAPLRMLSHGESYADALAAAQRFGQATADENPIATKVGEVGGAALGMAPAIMAAPGVFGAGAGSLGLRMAAGAGSGAAVGGADSAVRSGGDLKSSLQGAGLGLAGGAAGPVIGAAGKRIVEGVGDAIARTAALRQTGVTPPVADVLMRAMEQDGSFGGQGLANLRAAGPNAMLVDAGPNAQRVLDTAMQRGGSAVSVARQAIEDRAAQATANLNQTLDSALGRPQGIQATTTGIRNSTAAARRAAYDQAYAQPIDYSAPEGRAVEALFDRIPGSALSRANALMAVEGNHSRQMMLRQAADGSYELMHYPDVRQLDYVKRALGDAAAEADGQGKLGGTTQLGRAYSGLANDLRDALGAAVPDYRTALATAAEPIQAANALRFGNNVLKPGTMRDVVAEGVQSMTPAEMAHARLGVRNYLDDTFANVQRTATDPNTDAREGLAALKALSSRAAQEKMGLLVEPQYHDPLAQALAQGSQAQELRAAVARNSATATRTMTNETIKEATAPGPLSRLAAGEPMNAGKGFMQFLTQQRPADQLARQDQVYDDLVHALVRRRGAEAEQFLNQLQQAHQTQSGIRSAVQGLPTRQAIQALVLSGALRAPPALTGN